jgi:CMP-N,N'-diacetyllegionaminic acid synthase
LGLKPLISYPIHLAKSIEEIDRVIVTTDDKEIAKIAKENGAEVPFIRPVELADDETPTLPVLQHCVKYLEEKENYKADLILLLFPTCPFLKKETVLKAINILKEGKCNSVMSVEEDWGRFWKQDKDSIIPFYPKNYVNRQFYKPLLKENGAIYFSKYEVIMRKKDDTRLVDVNSLKYIIMNPDEIVDIDTPFDWKKAEERIKNERLTMD